MGESSRFCPSCFRTYAATEFRCVEDGTPLIQVGQAIPERQGIAAESGLPPISMPAGVPIAFRSGSRSKLFGRRAEDLRAGGIALVALLVVALPATWLLRPKTKAAASEQPAEAVATMAMAAVEEPLPARSKDPTAEPFFDREFANAQMGAGIAMKDFESVFRAWAQRAAEGTDDERAVARLKAASNRLLPHIEVAAERRPDHAKIWRAHRHLQQALILNAAGKRTRIEEHLNNAAQLFESVRETDDPLARSDLRDSLVNASGTYRFLLGADDDPLFAPLLQDLELEP